MSMEFGKGIGVSSGFDLGTKGPLDSRITVATIADRDAHSTKNRAYEGMLVYVEADKTLYQFVDNSWKPLLKDLKDKLDSIENQLGLGGATGEGSINDRINALEAKDTELYNKINSEEQARTNADNNIKNSINGEINRAKSAEEKLQSNIDNEITTRIQNISDLQNQINNINLNIGETGDLGAQVKANKEAIEIINGEDTQNGSIAKALKDAKTYADTELAKKADKEHGTHLTLGTGSGNAYRGDYGNIAYTHSQTAHAPSNAQKNSDITKTEIEAKLTGNITSHTHNQYLTQHQDISGKADVSDLTSHTENTSIHITADERRTWNNKAEKTVATIDSDGLMGADMVTKLNNIADGANNYKHPSTHAATMIIEDTTHRFVTDTDKSNWNNKVSTSSSVTTNHIAVFNDTTGKVIKDSGFTIATSVPANAKFTDTTYTANDGIQLNGTIFQHTNSVTAGTAQGDANKTLTFGGTFTIPTVTYDAQGHITSKGTTTMTMPATPTSVSGNAGSASKVNNSIKIQLNGGTTEGTNLFTFNGSAAKNINITPSSIGAATTSTATASANGLMSSTDKSKLDGIAANANNYSHPTYTSKTSGLYKVTVDDTGHISATTAVTKADITGLGIPGSDTTYSVATTSANGLMSSTDKSKLDGIAAGANKTTVDSSISDTSTNPIQNKVIKSYVDTKVADIVDSAPETLNTLKELSTALGNDPNFATTIATEIGTKANASDLTAHIGDATHITAAERTAWNAKSNLALGTTSATAFRGDYGNIAYTHSQAAHAPSDAQKNADITKAEIEEKLIGNITTHTHNYAGSSSAGGAATSANKVNASLVVKLNGGSTEGTNLFTFNGSAAKNINITPSSIGAATTSVVTTSVNGLMSSTDKSKLDGIAANANNYSHPTYTSKTSGLYKVTVDGTGHVRATTAVTKADITGLGIPGSDTTYSVATTSANGLMSSTDKSKLDGIAANANNYSHPTTSGNKHIPSGGSSGQILRWSADGTATWGADNNTATAASNILSGSNSGTQITYAPYTAQQAKLSFDTSTTNPTRTDRLNLNGNLHATNIASNTVKINGKVNMVYNSTTESLDFVFE